MTNPIPPMQFLLALVVAAHLINVNVSMMGPILCVWIDWRATRENDGLARDVAARLGIWSLLTLLVGGAAGLVAGAMMWAGGDTRFFDALARLSSKVYFGVWEYIFSVVCLMIYVAWHRLSSRASLWQRVTHRLVAVLAATNLMYHFPPLFVIIANVAAVRTADSSPIDAAAFRQMMFTSHVFAMTLHVWLAGLATSGLAVAVIVGRTAKDADHKIATNLWISWGARVSLVSTLLQIPVGMWLIATLSRVEQTRLMGGDIMGTLSLLLSIGAALWLAHQLAALSMRDARPAIVYRCAATMMAIILLMTYTLMSSRAV